MTAFEVKTFPAQVKVADGDEGDAGVVEALVSVFGVVDYGGDRVVKGAFADTLAEWAASGDPIPFVWSHNIFDVDAYTGKVIAAAETDVGLLVKAQLFLDHPQAAHLFRLMKERVIKEFSFTYEVFDAADVTEDGQTIRELTKLGLWEVGPCLKGMNPDTQLLAAASRHQPPAGTAGRPEPTSGDIAPTITPERADAALALLTKRA